MRNMLRFLYSAYSTAILLIAIACISAYASILSPAGSNTIIESRPFAALFALLFFNILFGAACRTGNERPRWLLVRIGALLVLSGAFAGRISGARALAVLHVGQRTDQFEEASGKILNPGFSLRLDRFMVIYYPGASAAIQSFQSAVTFIQAGRDVASGVVAVNRPLKFGGYRIYQSSCDPVQSQWSGLEIVRDPGLPLVYAGYCCIALGITLWMVIRQPHTQEEDHSWKPR